MRVGLQVAAILALSAPAPLMAQAVARPVQDRPAVAIDPAVSYVMVRSPGQTPLMLLREPDAADRAAWQARRDEAFADEVRRYPGALRRYQIRRQAWAETGRRGRLPDPPVEPTDANFQFPPIEPEMMLLIGPLNRFAKEGESTYLSEIRPGTYHIYGPLTALPGLPAIGYCLCMGTVKFEVLPNGITDMGRIVNDVGHHIRQFDDQAQPQMDPDTAVTPFVLEPASTDSPRDPRLAAATVRPAEYSASRQFPNYFGLIVDRINPVPGVIAYRRGEIIDVRAAESGPPTALEAPQAGAAATADGAATVEAAPPS